MTRFFARTPRPVRITLGYAILVGLVLNSALFDGFFSDGAGYIGRAAVFYSEHPFAIYLDQAHYLDSGHPLLICRVVGWFWRWCGLRTFWAHGVVWLTTAIALASVHEIARLILPQAVAGKTGVLFPLMASLMLLSHPLFIAMTAQFHNHVPSAAFAAALILALVRGSPRAASLWGFMLVTNRITDVFVLFACFLHEFVACHVSLSPSGELRLLWRKPGFVLARLSPFLLPGFIFTAYHGGKICTGMPLTTFPQNQAYDFRITSLLTAMGEIFRQITSVPRFGLIPLLLIALLAMLISSIALFARFHATGRRDPGRTFSGFLAAAQARNGTTVRFYTLAGTVFGVVLCLHTFMSYHGSPRYYILLYPLIILAGVHGLACLTRYRRLWFALAAMAWIAPQIIRWHPSRLQPFEQAYPMLRAAVPRAPARDSLDFRAHVLLAHKLAADIEIFSPRCVLFGLSPTLGFVTNPWLGYTDVRREGFNLHDCVKDSDLSELVVRVAGKNPGVPLLCPIANWDAASWRLEPVIRRRAGTRLLMRYDLDGRAILRLYQLDAAAGAAPPP